MTTPTIRSGPCSPWFDPLDLTACCAGITTDTDVDRAAEIATDMLYRLSGYRYPGVCEQTVRPQGQGCFDHLNYCCCHRLSIITLAGYPIREIIEVRLNGEVLPVDDYRLDRNRQLVRIGGVWPSCQNLSLADGDGTLFVTYEHGLEPPPGGAEAALQLACEVAKALCAGSGGEVEDCSLPAGTVRVTRQGVSIETQELGLWLLGSVRSGMPLVDAFLALHAAPRRMVAALSVPELGFPLRVG
jgi:hypothetical protein